MTDLRTKVKNSLTLCPFNSARINLQINGAERHGMTYHDLP